MYSPLTASCRHSLVLAWQSSELDVAKAAPASVLPTLVELVDLEPHLKAQATAMLARGDSAEPDELYGLVTQMRAAGVSVGGASMLREYQPAEQIQTSLAEVALSAPVTTEARAVGAAALGGWLAGHGVSRRSPRSHAGARDDGARGPAARSRRSA